MVIETRSGARYYVMREAHRKSDPTPEQTARVLGRASRYSADVLAALIIAGAVHEIKIDGRRFAFVRSDVPFLIGGRPSGFWKVFQRRFGYVHAVKNRGKFPLTYVRSTDLTIYSQLW